MNRTESQQKFEVSYLDKVLVRNSTLDAWQPQILTSIRKDAAGRLCYVCANDRMYRYCVPYGKFRHLAWSKEYMPGDEFWHYNHRYQVFIASGKKCRGCAFECTHECGGVMSYCCAEARTDGIDVIFILTD